MNPPETPPHPAPRIGHGYDLHRLEPLPPLGAGKPLILGGVRLEHDRGPVAHSDGDALYHAVTDAILGALALPDIGQLFPDSDRRYQDAHSEVFLREAVRRASAAGWRVGNLDVTVILERPRLSTVKETIRSNLARVLREEGSKDGQLEDLEVHRSAVNVKGKTHERVDAVGEGRAVEVHAVVLLVRA